MYLPEILKATRENNIPIEERTSLLTKFIAFLMKIGYGFIYQEQLIKIPAFNSSPVAIYLGAISLPLNNYIADAISGFH